MVDITIITLLIINSFQLLLMIVNKIKKSSCLGAEVIMKDDDDENKFNDNLSKNKI